MKRLTSPEWGHLPVGNGEGQITWAEADRLLGVARTAALDLRLGPEAILAAGRDRLRAGQVVGLIAAPGITLEILPKIGALGDSAIRRNLVRMIAEVEGFPLSAEESAFLERQDRDLLEILIGLFARRLLAAVRPGLARGYVAEEDDLPALRGRLVPERQFARYAGRADRLACRFDTFSADTPLNRILRAAALHLLRLTRLASTARALSEAALHFEGVGELRGPLPPVPLDRTSARFAALHAQARLFLQGRYQSATGGGQTGQALLFPMNDLFEAWVARTLRRRLRPEVWTVTEQGPRRPALTRDGTGLFQMRPDIVLKQAGYRIVLDTKWKRLLPLATDPKRGVAQADVYQLLAYAQAYRAGAVVLLYPGADGGVGRDRLRVETSGQPFWLAEVPLEDLAVAAEAIGALVLDVAGGAAS